MWCCCCCCASLFESSVIKTLRFASSPSTLRFHQPPANSFPPPRDHRHSSKQTHRHVANHLIAAALGQALIPQLPLPALFHIVCLLPFGFFICLCFLTPVHRPQPRLLCLARYNSYLHPHTHTTLRLPSAAYRCLRLKPVHSSLFTDSSSLLRLIPVPVLLYYTSRHSAQKSYIRHCHTTKKPFTHTFLQSHRHPIYPGNGYPTQTAHIWFFAFR